MIKKLIALTMIIFSISTTMTIKVNAEENNNANIITQQNNISEKRGNTTGNIVCGGSVATEGEWNYYIKPVGKDNNSICKIKVDGSEEKEIISSKFIFSLNVLDGWLYYVKNSSNNIQQLCKAKVDGSQEVVLFSGSINYCNLNVIGEYIYYNEIIKEDNGNYKNEICRIKNDGSEKTILLSNSNASYSNINVVGDWIYYKKIYISSVVDKQVEEICKIKMDGSQGETILLAENSGGYGNIIVSGDCIYYTDTYLDINGRKNMICKIRTDGTQKTEVFSTSNDWIFDLNIEGDWAYYYNSPFKFNLKPSLCKIKTDGTQNTILNSIQCNGKINIIGDWVYYNATLSKTASEWTQGLCKIKNDGTQNSVVQKFTTYSGIH